MRGDPPLIGGANAQGVDYRRSAPLAASSAAGTAYCRGDAGVRHARRPRYNPAHRLTSAVPLSISTERATFAPRCPRCRRCRSRGRGGVRALHLHRAAPDRHALAPWHARAREGAGRAGPPGAGRVFPGPRGQDRRSRRRPAPPLCRREEARGFASSPSTTWRSSWRRSPTATATSAPAACCGLCRRARSDASPAAAPLQASRGSHRVGAAPSSWTQGYYTIEPVLIYNTDGFKPANWSDLDGEIDRFFRHPGPRARNRVRAHRASGGSLAVRSAGLTGRAHRAGVGWRRRLRDRRIAGRG